MPLLTTLPHLENGINRRRFRVARAGYIGFRYRTAGFGTDGVIERANTESALWAEEEGRRGEATVIDYANDQLGEWSSDSSPAAKAIAVWQFAVVQVHLTRFESRSYRVGKIEEEERQRRK